MKNKRKVLCCSIKDQWIENDEIVVVCALSGLLSFVLYHIIIFASLANAHITVMWLPFTHRIQFNYFRLHKHLKHKYNMRNSPYFPIIIISATIFPILVSVCFILEVKLQSLHYNKQKQWPQDLVGINQQAYLPSIVQMSYRVHTHNTQHTIMRENETEIAFSGRTKFGMKSKQNTEWL